ncbi:hypothetical protein N9Y40_02825 [Porticoccaceae bacterium]|nr:hypothetical protein [Porticoccaceae bacterium]
MQGVIDAGVAFMPTIVTGIGSVAVAAVAVTLAVVGIRKIKGAISRS